MTSNNRRGQDRMLGFLSLFDFQRKVKTSRAEGERLLAFTIQYPVAFRLSDLDWTSVDLEGTVM